MIPLEATMPQADPRRDTIISFIDVSDLLDEEKTTTVPTTKNYPIWTAIEENPTTKGEVPDREIQGKCDWM